MRSTFQSAKWFSVEVRFALIFRVLPSTSRSTASSSPQTHDSAECRALARQSNPVTLDVVVLLRYAYSTDLALYKPGSTTVVLE